MPLLPGPVESTLIVVIITGVTIEVGGGERLRVKAAAAVPSAASAAALRYCSWALLPATTFQGRGGGVVGFQGLGSTGLQKKTRIERNIRRKFFLVK